MKASIALSWAKALKSGEYEQGADFMCSDRGHCCLGVLVELYHKEHDTDWNQKTVACSLGRKGYTFKGGLELPPAVVLRWAGLRDEEGRFFDAEDVRTDQSLAGFNDAGVSFEEIADMILDRYEEL